MTYAFRLLMQCLSLVFALLALVIAILALFGVYALMRSTITRFVSRCRGILRATKIASTLSYSCLEKSSCSSLKVRRVMRNVQQILEEGPISCRLLLA